MTIPIRVRSLALVGFTLVAIQAATISIAVSLAQQPSERALNTALGSAFTYQGRLLDDSVTANGAFDFEFALFDQLAGGSQDGTTIAADDVAVVNGLFSVQLNFGDGAFSGSERFLQVRVRPGAATDPNSFETLGTRQQLTATPYALYAKSTDLGPSDARYWRLGGNNGTTPGTQFIGTTDNQALHFRANNQLVFRVEPTFATPNFIFGDLTNTINNGVGSSILGGGGLLAGNAIDGNSSVIGGGRLNSIESGSSVIGGGSQNSITQNSSVISGGSSNTVNASRAAIGGGTVNSIQAEGGFIGAGDHNVASGEASVIGGGTGNTVAGLHAAIVGGYDQSASGEASFVGGGESNEAGDEAATVSGGKNNHVTAFGGTIAGGTANSVSHNTASVGGGALNVASGQNAVVSGGLQNHATASGAVVGGGSGNIASAALATVPGGSLNTANGIYSFAAGFQASAQHDASFVWSDVSAGEFASTNQNQFLVRAAAGVGIGTNAPTNQLHVVESLNLAAVPANHVALIENSSSGNSGDVLALKIGFVGNPLSSNNFITFFKGGTDVSVGSIEGNGAGSVVLAGAGADYAEWLPRRDRDETIIAGDIVGIFAGQVSKETSGASSLMIVSSGPLVSGNDPGEDAREDFTQVAFVGQAMVRVRGAVHAGDYIVASGLSDGTGVGVSPSDITASQLKLVAGQAWQNGDGIGIHEVRTIVGASIFGGAAEAVAEQQSREIAALSHENTSMEVRLADLENNRRDGWRASPITAVIPLLEKFGLAFALAWVVITLLRHTGSSLFTDTIGWPKSMTK